MRKQFSVCIATVRPHTLMATVESVLRQTYPHWELILIGQGDHPDLPRVAAAATRRDPRISYLHVPGRGVNRARNAGIEAAATDRIVFIDDDCEAREDWLATLACYHERWPDVGVIGGALIAPPKRPFSIGMCPQVVPSEAIYDPAATPLRPPPGWDWFTANLLLKREVIRQAGLFDGYFGAGSELRASGDYEYKVRLELLGIRMGTTPHAVVYHTYGYRYGLRAAARRASEYAMSKGAVAAKLMMIDPARGRHELQLKRHEVAQRLLRLKGLPRLPKTLWRLAHYIYGYRLCMRDYRVDPATHLLYPVAGR